MRTIVAVASLLLAFAAPSQALFHLAAIEEVNAAVGGDSSEQYVEIRMYDISQNFPQNSRLTAFDCDGSTVTPLLVVPGQLPNGGPDIAWIMATSSAATGGITPDFVFPAGLDDTCGMVCWGAPGTTPPDPATWDPTNPGNYVDCVAWGPYTGPLPPGFGSILTSTPGNGTQSLTRTGPNAYDNGFGLAAPSPTNNDGAVGSTRYMTIAPEHRRLEIGWTWLGVAFQRSGANREAKLLQMTHAFETLDAERVEFKTHARNLASRAALLGIGATFEGVLRHHTIMPDGSNRDSAFYGVIAGEWPDVKARLAAKLDR